MRHFYCFVFLLVFILDTAYSDNQTMEQALVADLLKNYVKSVRPVEQVVVNVSLSVKQIISIDEKNQVMTTSNYIAQAWIDGRLAWNESAFNGLQVIMVSVKSIWLPDTMIVNTADAEGYLKITEYNLATVHSSGEVYLIVPSILTRTRCDLNMKLYPFDAQNCSIILTSWSHASNRVHYNVDQDYTIDLSDFIENSIWHLKNVDLDYRVSEDRVPFEKSVNGEIVIEFILVRKPLYYMINGVFPCLIINFVTVITYLFPYAQQLTLCISIFLTYSVYSLRLSNDLPIQSDFIPLITIYFLLSISYTLLSLVWFYLCNYLLTRGSMPAFLDRFSAILRKLFTSSRKCERPRATTISKEVMIVEEAKQQKEEKCGKCDRCSKCETREQEDGKKLTAKRDYEQKVGALNLFMFICFAILMFISVLSVWIAI